MATVDNKKLDDKKLEGKGLGDKDTVDKSMEYKIDINIEAKT